MIKTSWFKAGDTINNGTSHQGVVDMNNWITKNDIQREDIINVTYILSSNIGYYILMYFSKTSVGV